MTRYQEDSLTLYCVSSNFDCSFVGCLQVMEHLADYFKVFSEPNRLVVLEALRAGALNVTAVVDKTGLSQALVSKHLKLLTNAGVVERRPEGSLVFYEVKDRSVFRLLSQAEKLMLDARRQQLDALAAIL